MSSLEEQLTQAKKTVIADFIRENPDTTVEDLIDVFEDELGAVFAKMTAKELGLVPPQPAVKGGKKNRKKSPPRTNSERTNKPRMSAAQVNSEFLRWYNQQENGTEFTMAQIVDATPLTVPQVKRAMTAVGGMEKHGDGPSTVYVVVEKVEETAEESAA